MKFREIGYQTKMAQAKSYQAMAGQSLLEATIAIPFFLTLVGLLGQLIWMFFAAHHLQSTAVHVANAISVQLDKSLEHQAIFAYHMKPFMRYGYIPPSIRLLPVAPELAKQHADYDKKTQEYQIDPNFAAVQLSQIDKKDAEGWMRLHYIDVEIAWCFPLRVPVVNQILYDLLWRFKSEQFLCTMSGLATSGYYTQLKTKVRVPLHSQRIWKKD